MQELGFALFKTAFTPEKRWNRKRNGKTCDERHQPTIFFDGGRDGGTVRKLETRKELLGGNRVKNYRVL